jgi:RNA polymerase nonessential primary-like sigma factor
VELAGSFEQSGLALGVLKQLLRKVQETILVVRVKRIKNLEEVYAELPMVTESFTDALKQDGGNHRVEWANAAGVSVAELRQILNEGVSARRLIIEENYPLVWHIIYKLQRKHGIDKGTTEEDLAQEGCISLLRSAESFDPEKGVKFGCYAYTSIRNRVQRTLVSQTRVMRIPEHVYRTYGEIKRATRMLQERGVPVNEMTDELVCQELMERGARQITPDLMRQVVEHVEVRPHSLDARGFDSVQDNLVNFQQPHSVEANVVQDTFQEDLQGLMQNVLDPDEVQVLSMRFGLFDGKPRNLQEVSEATSIPYRTTKNSYLRAIRKLRHPLSRLGIRDFEDVCDYEDYIDYLRTTRQR